MDSYNYRMSNNRYYLLNDSTSLFLVFVSFAIFCYFNFNKYALGDNIAWVVIPIVLMSISIMYNLVTSFSLSNLLISIVIVIVSISLLYSSNYIRNQNKDETPEDVDKLEIKYLVSVIAFVGIALISVSPLADWIAGDTKSSMYSKSFIFIYTILCYGIFIIIDSIRNYNFFNLKELIFDKDDDDLKSNKIGTIVTLVSWVFYSLIVFQGIQYISFNNNQFDARHYISIALMTLFWIFIIFINTQVINSQCNEWKSKLIKNDYQEVLVNIISYTLLLLVLSIGDRYSEI